MVYSTCSLNPLENEAVVSSALQKWRTSLQAEGWGLLGARAGGRQRHGLQAARKPPGRRGFLALLGLRSSLAMA